MTFSFPTSFGVSSGGFLGTGAFNYSGEAGTGQALSVAQQTAARSALQKWANVANLTFTEIADTPDTAWWPFGGITVRSVTSASLCPILRVRLRC